MQACQVPGYQMNPELLQKFNEIDKDKSGTLSIEELFNAYKYSREAKIDEISAVRMLMGAVTDKEVITLEEFQKFDQYAISIHKAFATIGGGQNILKQDQMLIAMQMLQLQFDPEVAARLFRCLKPVGWSGLPLAAFTKACAFFLACYNAAQRHAGQPVNYALMQALAVGFV